MCIRSLSFQWLPSVCGVIPLAPGLTEPEGASSKESVLVISTRILVENLRELPWAIPEGLVSPACFSIAGSASSVRVFFGLGSLGHQIVQNKKTS